MPTNTATSQVESRELGVHKSLTHGICRVGQDPRSCLQASCQMQPFQAGDHPAFEWLLWRDPTTLLIEVLFSHQAGFYQSHAEQVFPLLGQTVSALSTTVLTHVVLRGRQLPTHRLIHLREERGESPGPLKSGKCPS